MTYHIYPHIRTPMDLGNTCLGYPGVSIAPPICPVDRAEYGRRLAALEGGVFTQQGYTVPLRVKNEGRRVYGY